MNHAAAAILVAGLLLLGAAPENGAHAGRAPTPVTMSGPEAPDDVAAAIIGGYCVRCHNDRRLRGNMSLERFDPAVPERDMELAERMIRKLRAGMMPPSGTRRPTEDSLTMFATALEDRLDAWAERNPNPGSRPFQRLTRAEYVRSVEELLGLSIDAEAYLPAETMSGGYDNVADVQTFSATQLDAYLTAAAEVARMAIGDPHATPSEVTYEVSRYAEQRTRVPGAPFGTRGGLSVIHNFPADGDYVFRMSFAHESTGNFFGQTDPFEEQLEVSIDGVRVALLEIDRWMHVQDPNGVNVKTDPVFVTAGPKRVSVAFIGRSEGPLEDLVAPHEWSLADKKIGYSYGITAIPHLQDAAIGGPYRITGVSDHEIRRRIFTCRPPEPRQAATCARSIVQNLSERAYRRPVAAEDIDPLMRLFDEGAADDGFEAGIRLALQGILASPDFLFRLEEPGDRVGPNGVYAIDDVDLASRLSFFLWGGPPDDELIQIAADGRLGDEGELRRQATRMLRDERSEALGTRFAAQWLRLQDLDKIHPDALAFPDYYEQLAGSMKRETELFFLNLVRENRSLFEILTADYTFVDERLARHYGIPGIEGDDFRRVAYPDASRRGLLGQGSILTLTSHANRTSPVLRGKWVMEVLLGSPPPPPPPDVPAFEATGESEGGRLLTVRERMEMHRANPTCNACHRMMDPIGLALENFDVTGAWRIRDAGAPVDVSGELYDGTPLTSAADLREALLRRPVSLVRTFTENVLAYALGRRLEAYDMPTVRAITRGAEQDGYRVRDLILGVVSSPAFRLSRVQPITALDQGGQAH